MRGLNRQMSASREKRQRQAQPEQALTQKQRAELKEQKAAKQKTILYTAIGVVIAILVVVLLVWDSGIFQRGATALTIDGKNYNVNDVEYYYRTAMNTAYSQSYGTAFDPTVDLREQYVDEEQTQSYHDYFLEQAIQDLTTATALEKAANEAGYTLSQEDEDTVRQTMDAERDYASQSGYGDFSGYLKAKYGKYMTEGTLEACIRRDVLTQAFQNQYAEGLDITDEEIQTYYDEHKDELDSFTFRSIVIDGSAPSATDEEGNTVEPTAEESAAAMQAAKAKAEAFAAAVKEADDKEAVFAQLAPDYVSESSKESYESDPDYSLTSDLSGTSVGSRAYSEWMLDETRTAGDVGVIESSSSYYVVLFLDRYLDETPTADVRHILIKAELDQEDDAATTDVDESAIPSDAAMEAAKAEAEQLLAQWEAGDKTAESFGELANANSDDPGSNKNGGLYEAVVPGYMVDSFNDWVFAEGRKAGDAGLVENTNTNQYGWHVIYYQGDNDPKWKLTADDALRSEETNTWLTGLTEGLEATQGDGIKYVNP